MCVAIAALAAFSAPASAVVGARVDASRLAGQLVMVLEHRGQIAGFCTGIVIAPTVVATAAHCVPEGADLTVHYPDPAAPSPVLVPIMAVVRHPGYRAEAIRTRERSIDLALLRLPQRLPDRFTPARLGGMQATTVGARFLVAGYGVTREGDAASSGQLAAAQIAARAPLSSVLLWAGSEGGAGACTGDSGGPIEAEDGTIVALTLWASGHGRGHCGDLTQALWLAPHRGWIDAMLAAWSPPRP